MEMRLLVMVITGVVMGSSLGWAEAQRRRVLDKGIGVPALEAFVNTLARHQSGVQTAPQKRVDLQCLDDCSVKLGYALEYCQKACEY